MTRVPRNLARSRAQEKRGASLHGGRVQPGSGNGRHHKGDVRSENYLIEYKRTDGKQLAIKAEWLEKIRQEALVIGRVPLFGFELGGRDYVVMEAADLPEGCEQCRS